MTLQHNTSGLNRALRGTSKRNDVVIGYTRDRDRIKKMATSFPHSWSRHIEKLKDCVFAEVKGRVVGVCGISGVLSILLIYVAEGYRNKGIGRVLLKKMVAIAKQENYSFIMLSVGWGDKDYNLPARKLFQEQGFRELVDISKQTVMMLPIKKTTAKFAFACMRMGFSAVPKVLIKKVLEWIYGIVWT